MSNAASRAERRWWRLSIAFVALIYLSLWPIQFALDFLREHNLLRLSILALGGAVAAAVLGLLVARRAGAREWLALGGIAIVYLVIAGGMEIVQERLHLAEYGALALLLRAALTERWRRSEPVRATRATVAWSALGLAAVAGLVDELIQGVLPNRHWDLRDVGFNVLAAALALAAAAILAAARAADLRRKAEEWTPA